MAHYILERDEICETVLETVAALVIVLDAAGRFVGFNRACEEVSGYSFSEVHGKCIFASLLAPEYVDAVHSAFTCLRPDTFPQDAEYDWISRTGERRHILWNNAAIIDTSGAVEYIVGTGIEISERKAMEQQLERSNQEWERTFDAVPDLIAIVSADHRIVRVNQALADRLHRAPEDLIGLPCCKTLHGLPCNPDWCLQKQAKGQAVEHESCEPLLGGEYQMTVTPLTDSEGMDAGSVHVFRDLAPLREAEMERRRAELAKLDRAPMLGLLSVALAHELNQPLTAIGCNAQTALTLLENETDNLGRRDAMLRELLADIGAGNRRAAGIISGIRSIFEGRPSAAEDLPLAEVVHEAVGLLRTEAQHKGIAIRLQLDHAIPSARMGRVPLLQVLLNLLSNAFDAVAARTSGQRTVTITTGHADDKHVQMMVADSGPGIPADQLEAIFEPLNTSKRKGLGMGLAICRWLLAAYGGSLTAANGPEGGAMFMCILPVGNGEIVESTAAR